MLNNEKISTHQFIFTPLSVFELEGPHWTIRDGIYSGTANQYDRHQWENSFQAAPKATCVEVDIMSTAIEFTRKKQEGQSSAMPKRTRLQHT